MKRRGLTVIEVLVSLVVLATGAIITLGAIGLSVKATTASSQNSEAVCYSRRILEIALTPGPRSVYVESGINTQYTNTFRPLYSNDTGVAPPFAIEDFTNSLDSKDLLRFRKDAQNYTYRVQVSPFVDPVDPRANKYGDQLLQVTVEMEWFDKMGRRTLRTGGLYSRL